MSTTDSLARGTLANAGGYLLADDQNSQMAIPRQIQEFRALYRAPINLLVSQNV